MAEEWLRPIDPTKVGSTWHKLELADFGSLFATDAKAISKPLQDKIASGDFRYLPLAGNYREQVLLDVLKRIDSGTLSLAGEEGKSRWEKGWGENRDAFIQSGFDLDKLVPKYIRPRHPVRLNQQYVLPADSEFELRWYEIFRTWFLENHLGSFDAVFEFGCGSGFNVARTAQMFPGKKLVGLDWAKASSEILEAMAKHYGWNISGRVFDFFNPDYGLDVPANSAFFTIGALEQTGERWGAFLDFVLAKKPKYIFHIEPIYEWYETDNLVDYAARRFHWMRKYWRGYVGRVEELAKAGKVEVLKRKRSYFGSLFIEGYSQFFWRPL
jgi:SAM-dependent methyltransferase